MIPADPDGEWSTPDRALLKMRRLEGLVLLLFAGCVAALVAGLAAGPIASVIALGAAALVAAPGDALLRRRYRSWGYLEREDDLIVRRGVMFRRLSVIPYGRMQFIDVTAGPIERALQLATVQLHTAAAATDARIPGLIGAEATRLRDQLAERGEARAAGL